MAGRQSAQMLKITYDRLTRMLYSCTHMATVGFKGLTVWVVNSHGHSPCFIYYEVIILHAAFMV